jgi:ribosomal protein S7
MTPEHQLRLARASALTMRVLYLRRLAERLRWLVQQAEKSGNVERTKRFAKELAKTEAKLQKAEQERQAGSPCHHLWTAT